MYIKELTISESYPEEKLIRTVSFKKGPNFIVDASDPAKRGNGIGKTTALKLIDICLGAQDRKYIYTDYEMDLENADLKAYIHNSKIYAKLVLEVNDTSPVEQHTVRVDLFERGFRYLDNRKLSLKDFQQELNQLIFNNEYDKPTFRQLIGMFVRINQKSDNDKFLKYLNNFASDADYENIYSYLFQLRDHAASEELLGLKEKKRTLEGSIKSLKALNNIKSINVIEQMLIGVNKEIISTKKKLAVLVDVNEMKKNEDALTNVRTEYALIADDIDRCGFKVERFTKIIEDAEEEAVGKIDQDVLKELHEETKTNFAELDKTFSELVEFNKQLVNNKIDYFKEQLGKAQTTLNQLIKKRDALLDKYKDVVVLIKNNDVDGYVASQTKLEDALKEKGKLEKIVELYEGLSRALAECEEQIENIDVKEGDPKEKIAKFNDYFTPYSTKIIKEGYLLYLTEKTFPLAIANVKAGLSTGTKKSVISAFDLAYQSFAEAESIYSPRFIVHDVIETMDKIALDNTIDLSNKIGCQYIVAVLKDKVKDSERVQDGDIRLTLSEDNKLFRM
jgi:uncharacterized protein YydD (DUF2326 family)